MDEALVIDREERTPADLKRAAETLDAIHLAVEAGATDVATMRIIRKLLASGPPVLGKGKTSVALFVAACRADRTEE